jgi:hypothetical protein
MFNWLKKLAFIVKNYDKHQQDAIARMDEIRRMMRERTEVSADINYAGIGNHIIVVGRYKDVDHAQCFTVDSNQFAQTVERLRELRKFAKLGRTDVPPAFSASFRRHL